MIALIDSNNFYVSAERVFQPQLRDKAGCVLSNNDGCAISRSNEAKAMGLKIWAIGHQVFFALSGIISTQDKIAIQGTHYNITIACC